VTCKSSPLFKTDSKQLEKEGKDNSSFLLILCGKSTDVFLFIWSPCDLKLRQRLIEKIFQGTSTTFVGYLSGNELASAYASGDAFLFPSSTETLGLVLLEAMAAGCPVVGANKGGIPDIISDGENGCLYNPDGENDGALSLIEATQKLLGNEVERTGMRKAARSEAERWGWAGATKQLRSYYEEVLGNNQNVAA
jgi:glycosyltransferase involved in cell wall biosynthesis